MSNILNKISSIEPFDEADGARDTARSGMFRASEPRQNPTYMENDTAAKTHADVRQSRTHPASDTDANQNSGQNTAQNTAQKTGQSSGSRTKTTQQKNNDPDRRLNTPTEPNFRWMTGATIVAILMWLAISALATYIFLDLEYRTSRFTGLEIAGTTLFVIGPLLLILVTIYACRQLARLTFEAATLRQATQDLMTPDDTVVARTANIGRKIQSELSRMGDSTNNLMARVGNLQTSLNDQVEQINETSYILENRTGVIASQLREERLALDEISTIFSKRMDNLSTVLDENRTKLDAAAQHVQTRMEDVRSNVDEVAKNIVQTSETALSHTQEANASMSNNHVEIARLASDLNARAQEMDALYTQHAKELSRMIDALKAEQSTLGATMDDRLEKMREMSERAQANARHIITTSDAGRQTVEAIADAARLTDDAVKQRFAEMEEVVRDTNTRAETINQKATLRVQDSLAQTRKELERIEGDMMSIREKLEYAREKSEEHSRQAAMKIKDEDDAARAKAAASQEKTDFDVNAATATETIPKAKTGVYESNHLPDPGHNLDVSYADSGTPKTQNEAPETQKPKKKGLSFYPFDKTESNQGNARASDALSPAYSGAKSASRVDYDGDMKKIPAGRIKGLRPPPDINTDIDIVRQPKSVTASRLEDNASENSIKSNHPDHTKPRDNLDLSIETPTQDDLLGKDPDADITSFDPGTFRRPAPDDDTLFDLSAGEEKSDTPWWKRLLRAGQTPETFAIDQITEMAEPDGKPQTQTNEASHDQGTMSADSPHISADLESYIISALTDLGLTPSVIVDDGCLIEAVQTRKAQGPIAMSDVTVSRLREPVRHLKTSMALDGVLKDKSVEFARQFHSQLGPVEDDSDAVRARLESDTGRAFLLCDAALNL